MINWPNLLLIAGTGRNVGKTTFACTIIEQVSKTTNVIAIKITPHIHILCDSCVTILQAHDLLITEETSPELQKDSSKMLAAGAEKVYFIQGADNKMPRVLEFLQKVIPKNTAIICESAALRDYIKPGVFVLMSTDKSKQIVKNADKIELADIHIFDFEYDVNEFEYKEGTWEINEL